jgi:hypothetical protein
MMAAGLRVDHDAVPVAVHQIGLLDCHAHGFEFGLHLLGKLAAIFRIHR